MGLRRSWSGASSVGRVSIRSGLPRTYTDRVTSEGFRRIIGGAAVVLTVTACGFLPTGPRPGTVTIYGRAAPDEQSWFGLVPAGDPPAVVGFGSDGVGCLDGPPGTQIAWYDGAPGEGGAPRQVIAQVPADGSPIVLSVEVTPEGGLLVGHGVPAWWQGDPQVC